MLSDRKVRLFPSHPRCRESVPRTRVCSEWPCPRTHVRADHEPEAWQPACGPSTDAFQVAIFLAVPFCSDPTLGPAQHSSGGLPCPRPTGRPPAPALPEGVSVCVGSQWTTRWDSYVGRTATLSSSCMVTSRVAWVPASAELGLVSGVRAAPCRLVALG